MRLHARLVALLAALAIVAPGFVASAAASTTPVPATDAPDPAATVAPKVVIVVGATHEHTDSYRSYGDMYAAEALKYTPNVVKVYSPNATWSAVKAAAQGASIFIYLGHGSGFPKSDASVFNGDWYDGMGLNKASDPDDDIVRYYGENYVASEIRLAKNAVVLLSHLCYASGNSESGDPEPTYAVARQRIDNFASGFLRAGARTVIADVWNSGQLAYIRDILSADKTIGDMWRYSPSNHGHQMAFAPARNPAYEAIMDPNTWTTGFYRSIVGDLSMTTTEVREGAAAPFSATNPASLVAPGSAQVATAGLAVHADEGLATPTGAALAVGTSVKVDELVTAPAALEDGSSPPPSARVRTLDGSVEGWVSGGGLSPRDSAAPSVWSVDGANVVTPNFDGLHDRLDLVARFSETATWTARIRDAGGAVVRSLSGTGHQAFVGWDARIDGGPAPVGDYSWELTAVDGWDNGEGTASGAFSIVPADSPSTAVLAFVSTTGSATNSASVTFNLTFAGEVTGLAKADVARTGTASNCVIGAPTGAGASWSISVTKCSTGTLGLTLAAEAVADVDGGLGPAGWIASQTVRIDRTAPAAKAPSAGLLGGTLETPWSSSPQRVRLSWTATDSGGSGLSSYDVGRSLNGGAWMTVATGVAGTSLNVSLSPGTSYQFRVRARDKAGNVGSWAAGPIVKPKLVQSTSSSLTWKGTWTTQSVTGASGGSVRYATAAGAKVSLTFSGRSVAVVTTTGPDRGAVKVYLDGAYVTTLDLASTEPVQRAVVFSKKWSSVGTHTIRLVVVGTSGRPRVDIDAFEVLR